MEALNGSLSGVLDKVVIDSQHTGVIVDDDGPDDLGLHIGALPQTPRIGDHLAIPFTVTNADEQPAEGLHVSIETTSGLVAERGVIAIPSVPREAKSSTSVEATATGEQRVVLRLTNGRGRTKAAQVVEFDVTDRGHGEWLFFGGAAVLALLGLGLAHAGRPSNKKNSKAQLDTSDLAE